jgi:hypothetical protein
LLESVCLSRNGNLVFIAGGTLEPDKIHSIAERVDARAE